MIVVVTLALSRHRSKRSRERILMFDEALSETQMSDHEELGRRLFMQEWRHRRRVP
jgi:hypothetical protein